jgi:hypothetical protein
LIGLAAESFPFAALARDAGFSGGASGIGILAL